MKIDSAVKKETGYIALGMLVLSALMNSVYLMFGKWNMSVLYSNLLIGLTMILHFFLMGLTVQKAVTYDNQDDAKKLMKFSQSMRLLLVGAALAVGVCLSDMTDFGVAVFNFWALIPPLFFNRITVMIRGVAVRREGNGDGIDKEKE